MSRRSNWDQAHHDPDKGSWRSVCERCDFKILARTRAAMIDAQRDHERYRQIQEFVVPVLAQLQHRLPESPT